jgi:serine/threonine-protein kinase RsbW
MLSYNTEIKSNFADKEIVIDEIRTFFISNSVFLVLDAFELRLILDEAISNAVEHGNRFSSNKIVKIKIIVSKDGVDIFVKDEGIGFEFEDIFLDFSTNAVRRRGRGLKIIKKFAKIEWNEIGNEIIVHVERT